MAPDVREELIEWIHSHTALSMQERRATIAQVHAHMPQLLCVQPNPQPVYAALSNIDAAGDQWQAPAHTAAGPQPRYSAWL